MKPVIMESARPTRRGFLSLLGLSAGAVAVSPLADLDRLLWEPGRRLISIPKRWMPSRNQFIGSQYLTEETLRVLQANLTFVRRMQADFGPLFDVPVGTVINVRRPRGFTAHV